MFAAENLNILLANTLLVCLNGWCKLCHLHSIYRNVISRKLDQDSFVRISGSFSTFVDTTHNTAKERDYLKNYLGIRSHIN